jgi:hypothetical protein
MYTASSRTGNSLDHFKELVTTINSDDAPFDFSIRLLEQVDTATHFLIEFPPARRSFFHYANYPSATAKAYVTDAVLPWFYMKLICNSRGTGFDVSSMGGFYSATRLDHRFAKDIIPNFLGNHEDIYFCQGYGMPREWHDSQSLLEKIVTYINHYYSSTFNDSIPYYRNSMALHYLLIMAGDDTHFKNNPLTGTSGKVSQTQGTRYFTASQTQILTAYEFMSGFEDWSVEYPKMFRYQVVLHPDLDRGGTIKRGESLQAFIRYYQITTPDEFSDYVNEGFADHYIDEIDAYESVRFSPHISRHGNCPALLTPQQTLDVVNGSGSLNELQQNSKPQNHPDGDEELRHFYFYWNGTQL